MESIKRFFECLLPETVCNMKCSYCYVIQRDKRKMKLAYLKYSPEQIGAALTKERLGGTCYFSICGAGETTAQPEIAEIAFRILEQGHFVNITTNGSLTSSLNNIVERCKPYINHMQFAFSFHYLELIRMHMLDVFFENVRMVRKAGASFLVQLNLCDEYIPYLDEIKEICKKEIGAYPQIAATREEETGLRKIKLLTEHTPEEYYQLGSLFQSPLFDFTMKNFNVKRREFCYAGDWTGQIDLATGIYRRCYCSYLRQDIFADPLTPIKFLAVGNGCGSPFCMNSSHFLSLGAIPELHTPTYAELRNREEADWYNLEMKRFLSTKLADCNQEYTPIKKAYSNFISIFDNSVRIGAQTYRLIKRIGKKK